MRCTDEDAIWIAARRIVESVRHADPFIAPDGTPLPVTVTVGLARVHLHETLESAIARADAALYDGKQAGRDRWVLAEADLAAAGGTDERKTF